jgi:hypothetical protein
VTEKMQAYKRARGYHLRNHGGPMLGCSSETCGSRVLRLRSGIGLRTVAPYEPGGHLHEVRVALLAGTGDRV